MPKKKIIIANWKMKVGYKAGLKLASTLKNKIQSKKFETVLCPDFSSLSDVAKIIKGSALKLGAQNCSKSNIGAFTGEVSPLNLKEIGASCVIVGHSERRQFFGETEEIINEKLKTILSINNLIPILCIGEEAGDDYRLILKEQILAAFRGIKLDKTKKIIIAYEPIWAIGTGNVCPPNHAVNVHSIIKKFLEEIFSHKMFADNFRLVYGGSVDDNNAAQFAHLENVDGLLVGGASVDAKKFTKICSSFAG